MGSFHRPLPGPLEHLSLSLSALSIPVPSLHSFRVFFSLSFLSLSVSHTQSGFREAWQVRGSQVSRLAEGWLLLSHCKPQQGRCDLGAAASCQRATLSLYAHSANEATKRFRGPNLLARVHQEWLGILIFFKKRYLFLACCTSLPGRLQPRCFHHR